jgi:hypothetical protein
VSLFVCERVGVPVSENWRDPLPDVPRAGHIPRPVASAAAVAAAEASAVSLAVARLRTRLHNARDASDRSLAWMNARGQDTRWAVEYAMPWVRRRLTGRSSGDDLPPKRPELMPLDALGRFHGSGASESA